MAESGCSILGSPLRHKASRCLRDPEAGAGPAEGGSGTGTCQSQQQVESQAMARPVIRERTASHWPVQWRPHATVSRVEMALPPSVGERAAPLPFVQVARDIDGSGNYLLLTHKHLAQLPPNCCYRLRRPSPRPPSWVLYHEFTVSQDNCLRIVSEIPPEFVAELAPQYFLSNLPPSESRDLLMELREKLAEDTPLPGQGENPQTPKAAEDAGDACVLQ